LTKAPFDDIIPFLSEHVQVADQLLFVGAKTDLSYQLAKAGYGARNTGFVHVVDSDAESLAACKALAEQDPDTAPLVTNGRLKFIHVADLANMPQVCRQSVFDAIVDCEGLDTVLKTQGKDAFLSTIDHLQNAVR